jgi:hypothetical protein
MIDAGGLRHGDLKTGALFAFANAVIRDWLEWVKLGHRFNRTTSCLPLDRHQSLPRVYRSTDDDEITP